MKKEEAKFKALDWDGGVFKLLPTNDIVDAIYTAWNYEFEVYEVLTDNIIFCPHEDNETNSDWLAPYAVRLINHNGYRKLQNIKTGEIYNAPWRKEETK